VPTDLDADHLRDDDLVPLGGSWGGLLFDNTNVGLPLGLTWTFHFEFEQVEREYGDTPVSATVDWVPLPNARWQRMSQRRIASSAFAEPIESSVYFFMHHRYDSVELDLMEQRGALLHVAGVLKGDLDDLGIDELRLDAWLEFDGIATALSEPISAEEASSLLNGFTDLSGLHPTPRGGGQFEFTPTAGPRP
jgi:hypothetical protein